MSECGLHRLSCLSNSFIATTQSSSLGEDDIAMFQTAFAWFECTATSEGRGIIVRVDLGPKELYRSLIHSERSCSLENMPHPRALPICLEPASSSGNVMLGTVSISSLVGSNKRTSLTSLPSGRSFFNVVPSNKYGVVKEDENKRKRLLRICKEKKHLR